MQSINQTNQIVNKSQKYNNIAGIGNPQYYTGIQQATEKTEFNNFILKYFDKYKSIEEFKHIDLLHLLESNQEVYNTEIIEILEQNDPYFNHELTIPEAEILTPQIQEELIDLEYDFYYSEHEYLKLNNLCYDLQLEKNIFKIFMEQLEQQNEYFLYKNSNLIITDLYNFLLDAGYNDYYFNSETMQDLRESIIAEVEENYNNIIENIYQEFDYYFMVYIPAKDEYKKYTDINELETINKDIYKLNSSIKEYLLYNQYRKQDKDYFIKLSEAYIRNEITLKDINPILNYTKYYELQEVTQKCLKDY